MDTGLLTRTEKSVLFVIPWGEHWLIGDTDTEWPYDPAQPAASRADIEYLLAKVNHVLREPLTASDIEGVFAGLRPLVAARQGSDTTKLSREHSVDSSVPGLSVIAGGKYTTYRVMARDLIDAAVRDLSAGPGGAGQDRQGSGRAAQDRPGQDRAGRGRLRRGRLGRGRLGRGRLGRGRLGRGRSEPVFPASRTDRVPLAGADGFAQMWASRGEIAAAAGLPGAQVERLLGRYGSDTATLLAAMAARPALREPLPGAGGYLAAEVVYACTHEGAVRLDDVLSRRTRITIETRDRGAAAAPGAAALMAPELGWDPVRTQAEIDRYRTMIEADLAAESMPDDLSAYHAKTGPATAGNGRDQGERSGISMALPPRDGRN